MTIVLAKKHKRINSSLKLKALYAQAFNMKLSLEFKYAVPDYNA